MLRWVCGVTRRDNNRSEHIRGTTRLGQSSKQITEKTTEVPRPCQENEQVAHSEMNTRCDHVTEKKKRTAKPKVDRCV